MSQYHNRQTCYASISLATLGDVKVIFYRSQLSESNSAMKLNLSRVHTWQRYSIHYRLSYVLYYSSYI